MDKKVDFNLILDAVKKLLIISGIVLVLMSAHRFIFFVYFADFEDFKGLYTYLFKAFFLGVRYDLAIIAYVNSLISLSILIMWALRKRRYFKIWLTFEKFYLLGMFSLVFFTLIFDFGFYLYFKNHINILIFGVIEDDTTALISTIWENYRVALILVVAGLIALIVLFYYTCSYFINSIKIDLPYQGKTYPLAYKILFVFVLIAGNTLAARGSLGLFPLGVMDAAISPNVFINKLAVTGIHTLQQAVEFRLKENRGYDLIKAMGYENNIEQAFLDFLGIDESQLNKSELGHNLIRKTKNNRFAEQIKPNVIVIMMEGFGTDLLKYDSDSFDVLGELKRHFKQDYTFTKFLSGDIGTIGSLETLLLSIPKRPNTKAITQSKYAYNEYPCGAALAYKKAGYSTVFLYGGNVAWRNMLSIMPKLGFDTIEGEGAMNPEYHRNQWGVYDEFLFDHIYKKLSSDDRKPKFIYALTTSNHPPYSLPPTYDPLPLNIPDNLAGRITGNRKLAKQRFQTYQYSNQRVGELITRIKNSEFAANTIIAVTGDHNFWDVFDYGSKELLDSYSVPFYLYVPDKLRPKSVEVDTPGSHIDIMPTLYNLSLSDYRYVSLGRNMLDKDTLQAAFNVDGFIMSKDVVTIYSYNSDSVSYYKWIPGSGRKIAVADPEENHNSNLRYYKSVLAVTDYLIKNPFKL